MSPSDEEAERIDTVRQGLWLSYKRNGFFRRKHAEAIDAVTGDFWLNYKRNISFRWRL